MKELVGQGKPFYSSLDKAAGLLRRKVGTGAEFLKELMSIPGVKQTEVAERGLGELLNAPKMTHEQFMAALGSKPVPAIQEKVWGGDRSEPDSEATYHEKYTLPGGENYREMLIKAPEPQDYTEEIMGAHAKLRRIPYHGRTPEQESQVSALAKKLRELEKKQEEQPKGFPGVPQHFGGEGNILASMRLKDRTGPNGEKLLHLEELQSDWHQKGRERGYKSDFEPEAEMLKKRDDLYDARTALVKQALAIEKTGALAPQELIDQIYGMNDQLRLIEERKDKARNATPDAPFKKNWEEMALKRLIHHAAENGYHGIVVTPGAEQADRYGLAKHVGMISYHPGEKRFQAFKHNRETVVNESGASPERVAELIGKEAAKRLLEAPKVGDHHFLEGEDLNIGGEGMKGFYDKKVPNILNSIGKKYGVKTELNGHNLKIREDLNFPEELSRRSNLPAHVPGETKPVHYFPITEEMRQDVKQNGIPLYESGGSVSTH